MTAALRDVGTFDPAADLLGSSGFAPPTLLGAPHPAPYLHDGSAATFLRPRRRAAARREARPGVAV